MSEAVLQRLILGQLHQLDRDHFGGTAKQPARLWAWRANTGVAVRADGVPIPFGKRGQCDVTGVLLRRSLRAGYPATFLDIGQRLEIEVKAKGKKRNPDQVVFGERVSRLGALYIVAYSLDDVLTPVKAALGIAT